MFKILPKKLKTNVKMSFLLAITIMFSLIVPTVVSAKTMETTVVKAETETLTSDISTYNKSNTSQELRGVWIASVGNNTFPSKTGLSAEEMKKEIDAIIKTCVETNLNAIFFQVRPCADALYNSSVFPTSKYLSGKQGDRIDKNFDPLDYIIKQAHKNDIELHAWINPYRVTYGSTSNPAHDLSQLAKNHPAVIHPEYTVAYPDGMLYFNPALPEVQALIIEGVREIVKNYDVDGIHFDDYFYPYPVYETVDGKKVKVEFDDAEAYTKYGAKFSNIDDFRHDNVNTLMKKVYSAIKKIDENCRFGISPFGIWANSSSNPQGSQTNGFESYYSLYSDATAWVKDKSIDYLCPQIYWNFASTAARFDILVRWWSALVDGTDVDLYIGHATYKLPTEFKSSLEIPRQVEYARNYMNVKGSVFYGYKNIEADDYSVKTNLAKLFEKDFDFSPSPSAPKEIIVGRPTNETAISGNTVYIMASSDPRYPVYYNNEKVTRTKSGFFSVLVNLQNGKNTITFMQNGKSTSHVIYKGAKPLGTTANSSGTVPSTVAAASTYKYPQMDSYKVEIISPKNNYIVKAGTKISVRVQAPSNSKVTASLKGLTIELTALTNPPNEGKYMTEVYAGTIALPDTLPQGSLIDYGNIVFTATRNNESATATGVYVKVINSSVKLAAEVINDYSHLKIARDSSFYDDYLPASVKMRDYVIIMQDGYCQLKFGGWIAEENVKLTEGRVLPKNKILSTAMTDKGVYTQLKIGVANYVPMTAKCVDGVFKITLFNTPNGENIDMSYVSNPIFKDIKAAYDEKESTVTYTLNLKDADNFYGFEVINQSGFIYIRVKNPRKIESTSSPLKGLSIIVDAGHGGTDPGALGFMGTKGKNEKDLNLEIALALEKKLTALGAKVTMIRTTDETVDIYSRMDTLNEIYPDLCISIHHNSMAESTDSTYTRGLLPLYCNDSGRLLAKKVGEKTAQELNRLLRDTRYQSLAMLRNHKFPATLIEMCFISNPEEYEEALRPSTVEKSAEGLAKGVVEWLNAQQKFLK